MPEKRPVRERAYLKKASKELLPEILKAELILPASIPPNRQAWVDQRAKQVLEGELTYEEVGSELQLTETEILFSKLYMTGECQGNHSEAATIALGLTDSKDDKKKVGEWARPRLQPAHPCMLLAKVLLNGMGLNDANVDRKLFWLIEQTIDPKTSLLAIEQYNKLTGRLKKQIEIIHKHIDFSGLEKKQLQQMVKWIKPLRIDNGNTTYENI